MAEPPNITYAELQSGQKGVAIGEEDLFLSVECRGPAWWRFRLIDLHGECTPRTQWITVKRPGDLSTSHRAKTLRSILKAEYKAEGPEVLGLAIGVVQDNEEDWIAKSDEPESPHFSDEVLKQAMGILEKGDPFQYISEQASRLHAGDTDLIQVEWISALSGPLSDVPINLWTIGKSGKGKTHSKYTVVTLLPNNLYLVFTSASPLSLFYYIKAHGTEALAGILLFIDEVEASRFAMPMLRSLTSQTPILPRHLSVHEAEVLDLKIVGKRAVWFTSVKTFGSNQIKNRFVHVNPDETQDQDARVFQLQDAIFRQDQVQHNDFTVTKALAYQIVKDTKDAGVVIPYGIDWPFKERRWLYPIFLSFIKTICKIRYKQREKDDQGKLIATPEDFEIAKDLWHSFEHTIAKRVTGSALTLLECLDEARGLAKTHAELTDEVPLGTRQISNLCEELLEEGLVNRQKRGAEKGRPAWEYWKAPQPTVADIQMIFRNSEMTLEDNNSPEKSPSTQRSNVRKIISANHFQNSKNTPTI